MPGVVEDPGGRIVVGGQHREALAVGVHPEDVGDGQAADGIGRGTHRACSCMAAVCPAASRSSNAAATRSRSRSATARLDRSGSESSPPHASRITTRFVSVPNPEPGLGHVVGHEEVDALSAELPGGPLQGAGLGREADEDRARVQRLPGRVAEAVEPASDPADLGQEIRGRLELEAQALAAGELALGRVRRREVGDGGRHHERIEAGRRPSPPGRRTGPRGAPRAARRSSRPGRRSRGPPGSGTLDVGGDEGHHRPAIEGRLGDRHAHPAARAVADEAHRVDGLPRPAGGDDDVAARQIGLARRARRPAAAARGRGLAYRRAARPRPRPRRRCAAARRAGPRRTGPRRAGRARARRPRSRRRPGAGRRSIGWPGGSTCRRPSPARRPPAPTSQGR